MKHQKMYQDFLTEQGFAPKVLSNDDIMFKFEGKTFIISLQQNDEQYMRLIMPNFWTIDDAEEENKALKAANGVNSTLKVATIIIVDKSVWAVAEMIIEKNPILEDFFMRTLDLVKTAPERFAREMNGERTNLLRNLFAN